MAVSNATPIVWSVSGGTDAESGEARSLEANCVEAVLAVSAINTTGSIGSPADRTYDLRVEYRLASGGEWHRAFDAEDLPSPADETVAHEIEIPPMAVSARVTWAVSGSGCTVVATLGQKLA